MSLMLTQPVPGRSDAPEASFALTHQHVRAHTHVHTHMQAPLCWHEGGSSPSLIPVELSTAHPAEDVSIAPGHAVRATVSVSHGLRGKEFFFFVFFF